jgi:hypothetical protein
VALRVVSSAHAATAHVVEVTTAVSVADMHDEAQLEAVQSAVDGVLHEAIA